MASLSFFVFFLLFIWTVQINKTVEGLDECTAMLHSCPENSKCMDTDLNVNGTTTCTCNPGFTGNQTYCKDINECASGNACSDKNAICENTQGGFLCLCPQKYKNVNGTCVDVDECADAKSDCHEHAKCTNLDGGHNCTCKPGFIGDGKSCSDINECLKNNGNCHENASCVNLNGTFACNCLVKVKLGSSCQASSFCPTTEKGDSDDDDNDVLVILVSIVIALLACCLVALILAIICLYRLKSTEHKNATFTSSEEQSHPTKNRKNNE